MFAEGKKLMIYADGSMDVYDMEDHRIRGIDIEKLLDKIKEEITVSDISKLQICQ